MKGRVPFLPAALPLLLAAALWATDPPHRTVQGAPAECDSCHTGHGAPGGVLTNAAGNVNLCQSCHQAAGTASALPVNTADRALPGQMKGYHHNFDVSATNSAFGALPPLTTAMSLRVMNNNIVCSTCHDQHAAGAAMGGTMKVSAPVQIVVNAGAKTLSAGGAYTDTVSAWYLIDIVAGGAPGAATFRVSKDNGLTWFATQASGTAVALPDGKGLTLTFGAGTYGVGERWRFYTAWPFLRAALDSGDNSTGAKYCRDCHRAWTMTAASVEVYDGTSKSHPVGTALLKSYDRAAPLDGNGLAQNPGDRDANPTNDLRLDAGGRVQCLTCHGVHYADSNTATVDAP